YSAAVVVVAAGLLLAWCRCPLVGDRRGGLLLLLRRINYREVGKPAAPRRPSSAILPTTTGIFNGVF
ncbi:MAG TPA: hypothetical protein VHD33_07545, partial [Legionellaceae bacterium]|nr:hypothetical protein [Legionellaceae bacterium]